MNCNKTLNCINLFEYFLLVSPPLNKVPIPSIRTIPTATSKKIDIIGSPMNFSLSKIKYKKSPPSLGEDTCKFLKKFLKISEKKLDILKKKNII